MPCKIPAVVERYLREVEAGPYRVGPEVKALAAYVRRVFETEELQVETERLEKYLCLARYFPFERLFQIGRAHV